MDRTSDRRESGMTDQQDRRLSAQLREAAQEMRKQERGAHAKAIERAAKLAELHEALVAAHQAQGEDDILKSAAYVDAEAALLAFTGEWEESDA